jgi:hypothetical protein
MSLSEDLTSVKLLPEDLTYVMLLSEDFCDVTV